MNANSNSPRTIAVENTREGWSMLGVLATRRAWPNFAAENPLDIANPQAPNSTEMSISFDSCALQP